MIHLWKSLHYFRKSSTEQIPIRGKNEWKEKVFETQGYLKYPLGHKSLKFFLSNVQRKRENKIKCMKKLQVFITRKRKGI